MDEKALNCTQNAVKKNQNKIFKQKCLWFYYPILNLDLVPWNISYYMIFKNFPKFGKNEFSSVVPQKEHKETQGNLFKTKI